MSGIWYDESKVEVRTDLDGANVFVSTDEAISREHAISIASAWANAHGMGSATISAVGSGGRWYVVRLDLDDEEEER